MCERASRAYRAHKVPHSEGRESLEGPKPGKDPLPFVNRAASFSDLIPSAFPHNIGDYSAGQTICPAGFMFPLLAGLTSLNSAGFLVASGLTEDGEHTR